MMCYILNKLSAHKWLPTANRPFRKTVSYVLFLERRWRAIKFLSRVVYGIREYTTHVQDWFFFFFSF